LQGSRDLDLDYDSYTTKGRPLIPPFKETIGSN